MKISRTHHVRTRGHGQHRLRKNPTCKEVGEIEKKIGKGKLALYIVRRGPEHYQVWLYTKTKEDLIAVYNNPALFKLYKENHIGPALRSQSTGVHRRTQEDIAFGV